MVVSIRQHQHPGAGRLDGFSVDWIAAPRGEVRSCVAYTIGVHVGCAQTAVVPPPSNPTLDRLNDFSVGHANVTVAHIVCFSAVSALLFAL